MSVATPFPPLIVGSVKLDFPVVQAALSGYSDWPMRVIARRFGASYTLCEVMLDKFLIDLKDRKRTSHFLHISDDEHPVGGQLMGAEPEQFALGAKKLVEAGFDVIDINFGCPVKKVLGRCRGGYHLSQPQIALDIVRKTRDIVPSAIPVTLKMRRGIDDSSESRDNFFAILDSAFDIGVSAVTVHGRTVKQGYIGPSNWEFLAEVKRHVGPKTIIGSGDLFTPHDCLNMMKQTKVNGVSVARGCIGNPWIFQQVRALALGEPLPNPPSLHEQRDVILEHLLLAEQLYGSKQASIVMRKFGIKYSILHPQFELVRAGFASSKSLQDWKAILHEFYAQDLPGVHPNGRMHSAQKSCAFEG
ncbi:MAG TPA: tRNA-dihydrouridine synthase [Pirellulaceae bacterium]|nr:tRNA-dihydrouridine synthase [Pirellulaceae bacterium]HMO91937.1 tRNA-dihydrouridine synthase [Pirellulaceae bacterium]HMP68736.1 tRNA-dihydrouridine synthase [Pirellulaceae bacterium]